MPRSLHTITPHNDIPIPKQSPFLHPPLPQLLLHTPLHLLSPLHASPLKILILAFKPLFILGEGAVHDSVEVLLHFFDVFFGSHEALHEDVELL